MRQLPRGFFFLRMRGFFLKNEWHFKDIFREIGAFFNQRLRRVFQHIFSRIEAFLKRCEGFSSNVRHFQRLWGFLKPCSEKWRLFWRHFQRNYGFNYKSEAFQRLRGFFHERGTFWKILRLFKYIFKEVDPFL
jgi:hypothetical protein